MNIEKITQEELDKNANQKILFIEKSYKRDSGSCINQNLLAVLGTYKRIESGCLILQDTCIAGQSQMNSTSPQEILSSLAKCKVINGESLYTKSLFHSDIYRVAVD
ncbi:MAG: hypothetical protein M1416_02555 [Candidatus Pacearchaeota archaeon]|nr:hypothetical protein [Candidatus Pacearchaeota archaeon]